LAAAACWQARQLQAFGSPALIFVDEPALYHYGTSTAVGLGRPEIEASLEEIFTAVRSTGGLTGLHSCAGNDWSLVTGLSLDIINFDAYDYFSSLLVYSDLLNPLFHPGRRPGLGDCPFFGESSIRRALFIAAAFRIPGGGVSKTGCR